MKVGDSVQHAIDDWEAGKVESAMLHACNAIDGTAAKTYPELGSRAGFTRLLRDNYPILGPMALPGIDIEGTRFPVTLKGRPSTDDGKPDIADVIYGVHRCTHAHGDELPNGFDLIPDAAGAGGTRIGIAKGRLQLSDRVVFGLLGVAIMAPANVGQRTPDGYVLTFGRSVTVLTINDWWGRAADFPEIAATEPMPFVRMDFGDWMDP